MRSTSAADPGPGAPVPSVVAVSRRAHDADAQAADGRRARTRDSLVAAAGELFGEQGVHGTGVEQP